MSRGLDAVGPLPEFLPEWAGVLLALVTQLGDVWFLAVLLGLVYWGSPTDRDDIAALAGIALAGLAFGRLLKAAFALPRPAQSLVETESLPWLLQSLYEATGTATGYGFPSLHALLATIVYLGLAWRLSIASSRRRWGVAILIVATVSLTRVALGVHYLVDVIAGGVIGFLFLAGMDWLLPRETTARPTVAFGLAVCFAGGALAVGGLDLDGLVILLTALGLFTGWQLGVRGGRPGRVSVGG